MVALANRYCYICGLVAVKSLLQPIFIISIVKDHSNSAVSTIHCYHNIIQTFTVFTLLLENLRMLKLANFNYTSVAMCKMLKVIRWFSTQIP